VRHTSPAARRWSVDEAAKAFAAIAALAYVLGTVCINGYLLNLGASDFSLFRARFVLTGSLVPDDFRIDRQPGDPHRSHASRCRWSEG
jgi:hypothetical protein